MESRLLRADDEIRVLREGAAGSTADVKLPSGPEERSRRHIENPEASAIRVAALQSRLVVADDEITALCGGAAGSLSKADVKLVDSECKATVAADASAERNAVAISCADSKEACGISSRHAKARASPNRDDGL